MLAVAGGRSGGSSVSGRGLNIAIRPAAKYYLSYYYEVPPALKALAEIVQFNYCSQGPYGPIWEFTTAAASGSITLYEDSCTLRLETIDIEPRGQGLGTEIIRALFTYAETAAKELVIPGVMNSDFFARFDNLSWIVPEGQLLVASYAPTSSLA
jgi:hypothetical protein